MSPKTTPDPLYGSYPTREVAIMGGQARRGASTEALDERRRRLAYLNVHAAIIGWLSDPTKPSTQPERAVLAGLLLGQAVI
jgi:hypothetical protein